MHSKASSILFADESSFKKREPFSPLRCEFHIIYAKMSANDIITDGSLSPKVLSLRKIRNSSKPSIAISSITKVVRIKADNVISAMARWKNFFLPSL